MSETLDHLVAICVAVAALLRGYTLELTGQMASVLGMSFGIVGTRVLRGEAENLARELFPELCTNWNGAFVASTFASIGVYCAFYCAFELFAKPLRQVLRPLHGGTLNGIAGSVVCCAKWIILLSLAYNLALCFGTRPAMLRQVAADDYNVVECVLLVAPSLLGGEDAADLAHRRQLLDARKISDATNFVNGHIVNKMSDAECEPRPYIYLTTYA